MTIPQLPDYVAPFKPVPNVQPFTYRDHVTMLKKLDGMVKYINKDLVPFVNQVTTELGDDFETQVNVLIAAVNLAIQEVINASVEIQDPIVAEMVNDEDSQTRIALDGLYAAQDAVTALENLVNTGRLSDSQLDLAYASKSSVDTLTELVNTGRLSATTLAATFAAKGATETAISGLDSRLDTAETDIDNLETAISGIGGNVGNLDKRYDLGIGVNAVASYFLTSNQAMHIAVSVDGNNFVDSGVRWVPGSVPGGDLDAMVRDPDLALDSLGAKPYLVVYTRPTGAGGGAFGTTDRIGVAHSNDLLNWTEIATIAMPVGVNRTWAPELFIDETGTPHIFVSLSSNSGGTFQIWELRATNTARTTWTSPVVVSGLGSNVIDFSVIKGGDNLFHGFVKNETTKYIEHATATQLTGPYTLVNAGNWMGIGNNVEGPKIVKREDGGYRLYFDSFNNQNNILFTDGDDTFDNWSTSKAVNIPMNHIGIAKLPNNGSIRAMKPAITRNLNAIGSIFSAQEQAGALDIIGTPYNGFTAGKTRISLVSEARATNPGSIYYTAGHGTAGEQAHIFEFDRGPGLLGTVGFQIKELPSGKVVVVFPSYTTANRPSPSEAIGGAIYDVTEKRLLVSDGTQWVNQDGSAM